jgi:hypothetical protein
MPPLQRRAAVVLWYIQLPRRHAWPLAVTVYALCLVGVVNFYLRLGLFGEYSKVVFALCAVILILFTYLFVRPRREARATSNNRWRGP